MQTISKAGNHCCTTKSDVLATSARFVSGIYGQNVQGGSRKRPQTSTESKTFPTTFIFDDCSAAADLSTDCTSFYRFWPSITCHFDLKLTCNQFDLKIDPNHFAVK